MALVIASPIDIPPPSGLTVWQYALLLLLTGGGSVAIKQLVTAYKSWSDFRTARAKKTAVDYESTVNTVVTLLEGQLDAQAKDYETRLQNKDEYYLQELANRQRLSSENDTSQKETIDSLRKEVNSLRDRLNKYKNRFGQLPEEL